MEKLYLVTETYPNPGGDSNFVIPELQIEKNGLM